MSRYDPAFSNYIDGGGVTELTYVNGIVVVKNTMYLVIIALYIYKMF